MIYQAHLFISLYYLYKLFYDVQNKCLYFADKIQKTDLPLVS